MNETSKKAGYVASFCSVVAMAFFIYGSVSDRNFGPTWEGFIMLPCWVLSAVAGIVCLISGALDYLLKRKNSSK